MICEWLSAEPGAADTVKKVGNSTSPSNPDLNLQRHWLQSDFLILDLFVINTTKNTNTSIKADSHWFPLRRWDCLETQYLKELLLWFCICQSMTTNHKRCSSWKGGWVGMVTLDSGLLSSVCLQSMHWAQHRIVFFLSNYIILRVFLKVPPPHAKGLVPNLHHYGKKCKIRGGRRKETLGPSLFFLSTLLVIPSCCKDGSPLAVPTMTLCAQTIGPRGHALNAWSKISHSSLEVSLSQIRVTVTKPITASWFNKGLLQCQALTCDLFWPKGHRQHGGIHGLNVSFRSDYATWLDLLLFSSSIEWAWRRMRKDMEENHSQHSG